MNNVIAETHQGHRVVKLFNGQAQAANRFDAVNRTIVRLSKKITQATAAHSPFSELIASIALAVVIFIALWQSQNGYTTIGEFMAFIVAMLQMYAPIKSLANISIPMQTMFLAADGVCAFLDTPPEQDKGTLAPQRVEGRISFRNVDVEYRSDGIKALDNFNLDIRQGERVALVGRSGSGKSTVVNLLPRFVEPSAGNICIDGIDIADIKLDCLRAQFALVSQDVFLFDDTLFENVRYSRPDAGEAEVLSALQAANLQSLIDASPLGLHQPIGSNGSNLSGGQRQRVAIARAILKDAPILLLDEATSALDNESERLVQQALERLMENRTGIIVAHRLTTVESADRIIVMDGGKIIEQGTHDQLMFQNGYYTMLRNISGKRYRRRSDGINKMPSEMVQSSKSLQTALYPPTHPIIFNHRKTHYDPRQNPHPRLRFASYPADRPPRARSTRLLRAAFLRYAFGRNQSLQPQRHHPFRRP